MDGGGLSHQLSEIIVDARVAIGTHPGREAGSTRREGNARHGSEDKRRSDVHAAQAGTGQPCV